MCEGGWIESAGCNYPVKLPPPPNRGCSVGLVMRKKGISTQSLFPLLPPSRPLLYEPNRRRDHWLTHDICRFLQQATGTITNIQCLTMI